MSTWPLEISDAETIVRGICSPFHVSSSGKLKPQAFDPTPGTEDVSVLRHDWIGVNVCRDYSRKLENLASQKVYRGMAVLTASQIRSAGAEVKDSRNLFQGHADIKLGYLTPAGDPPPAEVVFAKRERTKLLASAAQYHADPDPAADSWLGPSFV